MKLCNASPSSLAAAAELLRQGGLVAFPTETVYGLGADAANPAAVARIFAAKGRPADHPLIVHLGDAALLSQWARDIPPAAYRLAEHFWPGPLTLILKRAPGVPDAVTGGQDTVGLRVPGHPVARGLLQAFGGGVAAPSANRFGRISPTRAEHVVEELGERVGMVIDGGACEVGIESSIIDLSGAAPRLLRPGGVSLAALAECLGQPVTAGPVDGSPRVSGALESHYAPQSPVRLVPADALAAEASARAAAGARVGVLAIRPLPAHPGIDCLPMPATAAAYARCLYARLRELDHGERDMILVELPPQQADWVAIHDRLRRAAHG